METNIRGNTIERSHHPYRERHYYDLGLCKDWIQYNTTLDADNFGVWVNPEKRQILTCMEGNEALVRCPTEESYHQELADMNIFYGPQRPAYAIVNSKGKLVYHYSERPK